MSSDEKRTRSVGQNTQEKALSRKERARRETVRTALDHVHDRLAVDEYRSAAAILADRLLPALDIDLESEPVADNALSDEDDLEWHSDAVRAFLRRPEQFLMAAPEKGDTIRAEALDTAMATVKGIRSPERWAKTVVSRTAESAESLAVAQGIIPRELDREIDILGRALQLGKQWTQWEMDMPDPLYAVNPDKTVPFHLSIGGRGSGKSTSLLHLVLDLYAAGVKIIDIHDRSKLESGTPDIAQQQDDLQEVRRKMGLPESLDDHPGLDDVDLEIYVPLTRDLEDKQVLYDEDGEVRVTPFVVDPSNLEDEILFAMIGDLTTTQKGSLREALMTLGDDWCLRDVADAIQHDVDASDGVKSSVIARLQGLQQEGWIRDSESDYLIDWDDIFFGTGTITVFSTSLVDSAATDMRIFLYLLKTVYEERRDVFTSYPEAAVVMREMHHVAPTQANRKNGAILKPLQKQVASEMNEIGAEHRHADMAILADTQQWMQLNKRVRAHVDRVFMFRSQYNQAEGVFESMLGRTPDKYLREIPEQEEGECTILADNQRLHGGDSPSDDGESYPFLRPVHHAPPAAHQIDTKNGESGWTFRAEMTDEYLDDPPEDWQYDIPDRLRFDSAEQAVEEDAAHVGVAAFASRYLDVGDSDDVRESKERVREAYKVFARREDYELPPTSARFGQWLNETLGDAVTVSDNLRVSATVDPDRPPAYGGIQLNEDGLDLLEGRDN